MNMKNTYEFSFKPLSGFTQTKDRRIVDGDCLTGVS